MLSAFAATDDLASCTRCSGTRSVDFRGFRARVADRPYRDILRFHLRRHDRERIERGLRGSLAVLPPELRRLGRELSERWASELRAGELDGTDCGEVIGRLEAAAREAGEGEPGDDRLFDLFEVATLELALEALDDPDLRSAVGVEPEGIFWRHRWNLAAAAVLAWGAAAVRDPMWEALLWAGLGLALLPPVARLVAGRADGA